MIRDPEQPGSGPTSLSARALAYATRRRPRHFVAAILAICLVTIFLLWNSHDFEGLVVDKFAGARESAKGNQETPAVDETSVNDTTVENSLSIPPKIWQILLPPKPSEADAVIKPEQLQDSPSWLAMNRDYKYTLVGHKGGRQFVENNFHDDEKILEAFDNIPNVGMKSDLLRYLLLGVEGGVYTDTDTVALKPIDRWIPDEFKNKVGLIVGIEFDRRDGGPWADISHWVQFCQWTIAAAPGHAVFHTMVDRILYSLQLLSEEHKVPVNEVKPTSFEVMNSTGPAAWTDVVFEHLQKHDPSLKTTQDISFMTEPKLYGDILVLPIDGFGMGQGHSNSTNDGTIPEAALVKHLFRGSWRDN